MRCKQCKQNQKGTPLTFEPRVRINWSMTSHFSLLSSTCRPLNGSRTLTLTSSLPPTDFRPSINWIFKMKQKEVVSVGNNETQTAANLCFLMPSQQDGYTRARSRHNYMRNLKYSKHQQWKQCSTGLFCSSGGRPVQRFLTPLADTLHSTGLGFDPLQACTPFPSMAGTLDWVSSPSDKNGKHAGAVHCLLFCWASTEVVYFQCCLSVTWLVSCEAAAILAHIPCTPHNYATQLMSLLCHFTQSHKCRVHVCFGRMTRISGNNWEGVGWGGGGGGGSGA